jgi:hypothetical protein
MQPVAVALVENVYQNRFVEYACMMERFHSSPEM